MAYWLTEMWNQLFQKLVGLRQPSRLDRLVERNLGIDIHARDSGWSAEARAEWEAELEQLYRADS